MKCRENCAACCIAPTITSLNKPAGVACQYLTGDLRCSIFGQPSRPQACADFKPEPEICGSNRDEALQILHFLEDQTS